LKLNSYAEGGADNPKNSNNEIIASNVDYLETWEVLEQCVHEGLVKSIGLSNFNHEQIDRLLMLAKIKPVMNQVIMIWGLIIRFNYLSICQLTD
jgi:diketogulonate reductase-like aldo/keto reductase